MQIRYTRLALSDLSQAYGCIKADSPQDARGIIEHIEKSIETLSFAPLFGKRGRVTDTHEYYVTGTPFIIIYREKEGVLEILSIIHMYRKYL